MVRITQLDSNLLLTIFYRSPTLLYLCSRLRRLAPQADTLMLKTVNRDTLKILKRYNNIKKIVCTWWKVHHQTLPLQLTSLTGKLLFCGCGGCAGSESIVMLPKSLTRLYLNSITLREEIGSLPLLIDTNLLYREEDYDPNVEAPVLTQLDGKNTAITHAVVLSKTRVESTSLSLYRNLTKLTTYTSWPIWTRDVASLLNLKELYCESLRGRWSELNVLTKLKTATVNIDSSIYLNVSPPNLTYLSVNTPSIMRDDYEEYPTLLTLKIRNGSFHRRLIEEGLPATLRELAIDSLISFRIECFSAPLTSLTIRIQKSDCIGRLPSTLTMLDVGTAEILPTTLLPKSLRVIRARVVRGTFHLPNFRDAWCSCTTISTRHENGMVSFSNKTIESGTLRSGSYWHSIVCIGLLIVGCSILLISSTHRK